MSKRRRRVVAESQADNRRRNAIIVGGIVIGLGLLGYLLFLSLQPPEQIAGLIDYGRVASNQHDPNLQIPYEDLPPHGGTHNPQWQQCGIYYEPIRPENAVHSLEHGVVWITYQEDLAPDDVEYLAGFVRGESHMLMSPYPNQRSPVVLTAWGVQLEVDDVPDERVGLFVQRFQQGTQTPERGATCGGPNAVGVPDER